MENILKKSSGRTERYVLAFAIAVVMVFETKDFDVDNGKEYSWEFKCKKKLCGFMWDEKQRNKAYCCGKEYSMYRKIS